MKWLRPLKNECCHIRAKLRFTKLKTTANYKPQYRRFIRNNQLLLFALGLGCTMIALTTTICSRKH